jgi:type IV secretory pathway VirB10-like protein
MKAFLCVAVVLFATSGCATSKESSQPAQAAGTSSAQAQPAPKEPAQAAPEAKRPPPPAASEAGATTAAEAAEQVHQEWVRTHGARSGGGSGGDSADRDDAPCSSDDQCALTRVATGGCCETLCVPRAVTRARADTLAAKQTSCAHGAACPDISCHPPGQSVGVKCEAGRCLAQKTPASRNQ